jgi:DNA-directed RNA polymerase subunit beta'
MEGTLGHVLINSLLPKENQIDGVVNKKTLRKALVSYARNDPEGYAKNVPKLKKIGDSIATYEGFSVGLDDIAPEYGVRDPIINSTKNALKRAKNDSEINKILIDAQAKLLDASKKHPGDLATLANSGGRGNAAQLMKTITTPAVIGDYKGKPIPFFVERSYSQGLSPAEAWIAGDESRSQVIKGQLGTADPGELGKIMATMMSGQVISNTDCGTKNGIMMDPGDPSVLGRFLAGSNQLIDSRKQSELVKKRGQIKVRSPMTCEEGSGICQKCRGTESTGRVADIGQNVGIKSSQALGEPLTQMALSSKHGVSLVAGGDDDSPEGLKAVRQFLEVPTSFLGRATLAKENGVVSKVEAAPQGGHHVYVGGASHYIPPTKKVSVNKGDKIEAGDRLSTGVPNPAELVQYKGLGAGRKYLVDSYKKVYEMQGTDMDQRHFETLAKSQLNFVKVNSSVGDFLPGEVVPYNKFIQVAIADSKDSSLSASLGKTLAEPVLHHLPGTRITQSMLADFKSAGLRKVKVTEDDIDAEAVMAPASRTPLLNPDWMERLSHRYQKDTLLDAVQYGERSNLHGHTPYTAIAFGKELRKGPRGTY